MPRHVSIPHRHGEQHALRNGDHPWAAPTAAAADLVLLESNFSMACRAGKMFSGRFMWQKMNDVIGVVNGRYQGGRVGVAFPDPLGTKALKPVNLVLPDRSPAKRFFLVLLFVSAK